MDVEIDDDELWSSCDVARLAGLSFRQIDYWCRQRIISPKIAAAGSGSQRRFDAGDVRLIVLLGRLRACGITGHAFRSAALTLSQFCDRSIDQDGDLFLIVAGTGAVELVARREAMAHIDEPCWVVPFCVDLSAASPLAA